jgi:hypothetical protein
MPGPGRYSTRPIFPGLGRCLQTGVAEARDCRSELVLVHVLRSVMFVGGDGYMSPSIYEQMAASARAWAQKHLDRLLVRTRGS